MALLPLNILEIAGQMPAEVTDETLMAAAITEKPAGLMKTLFGPYITKATPAIFSTLGPYKAHGITGTDWIDRITDIGLFNRLHIAMRKDPHVETACDDSWIFVKTADDRIVSEEPEPGWELVPEALVKPQSQPKPQPLASAWVLV